MALTATGRHRWPWLASDRNLTATRLVSYTGRMDTNGERWVTIAEAAEALGRPQRTIRRWASDGRLPSDRSGPLILVDVAGHVRDAGAATAATMADTAGQVATLATGQVEALRAEVDRLGELLAEVRSERDALQAETTRLSEVLVEVRSERDYLRQVHALAVSGEQRLLTEQAGERPRRRWRWPWRRRDEA